MDESLANGAAREVREEACAEVAMSGLIGWYEIPRIGQVHIFYRARLLSESVAAGELRELGYDATPRGTGRVRFTAAYDAVCRANINLRCADRVLVLIAEFDAPDFGALFEQTREYRFVELVAELYRMALSREAGPGRRENPAEGLHRVAALLIAQTARPSPLHAQRGFAPSLGTLAAGVGDRHADPGTDHGRKRLRPELQRHPRLNRDEIQIDGNWTYIGLHSASSTSPWLIVETSNGRYKVYKLRPALSRKVRLWSGQRACTVFSCQPELADREAGRYSRRS
jgi:hypothetical protein